MSEKYKIKILEKTFDVLNTFTADNPEQSLTDIEKKLDINRTTIYRILVNLETYGAIHRNLNNDKYRIGPIMLHYARVYKSKYDFHEIAKPYIVELAELTGETVVITKAMNNIGICIDRINSKNVINITADIGKPISLLRGASGKIVGAHLDEEELLSVYEFEKEYLNQSFDEIKEKLKEIKDKGYSISFEEFDKDTAGVAAPILDIDSKFVAGVALIGPIFRFNEENIKFYTESVVKCAINISQKLGYY